MANSLSPAKILTRLLIGLLLVVSALAGRDFYKILGVKRDANDDKIKRAYRKLAMKFHPDKVRGDDAAKDAAQRKFVDISAAYETLSDPEKRRMYDQVGEEGIGGGGGGPGGGGPGGFPGGGGFGGGGGGGFQFSFGGGSGGGGGGGFSDPFRMFKDMFGGGGGGGGMDGMGGMGGGRFGGGGGRPGRGGGGGGGRGAPDLFSGPEARDIVKLTSASFKATLGKEARGERVWVLEFYSPGCGHCASFAPHLAKFASGVKGAVGVGVVNCAAEPRICEGQGVGSYPTIKILTKEGSKDFTGPRTAKGLRDAVEAPLTAAAKVRVMTGDGAAGRVALDKLARRLCAAATPPDGPAPSSVGCVLTFSAQAEASLLELALAGDSGLAVGAVGSPGLSFVHVQVSATDPKDERWAGGPAGDLGLRSLPAVVVVHGSSLEAIRTGPAVEGGSDKDVARVVTGGGRRVYSGGELTYPALRKWLVGHLKAVRAAVKAQGARAQGSGAQGKGAAAAGARAGSSAGAGSAGGGKQAAPASTAAPGSEPIPLTLSGLSSCFGWNATQLVERAGFGKVALLLRAAGIDVGHVLASGPPGLPGDPNAARACAFVTIRAGPAGEAATLAAGNLAARYHATGAAVDVFTLAENLPAPTAKEGDSAGAPPGGVAGSLFRAVGDILSGLPGGGGGAPAGPHGFLAEHALLVKLTGLLSAHVDSTFTGSLSQAAREALLGGGRGKPKPLPDLLLLKRRRGSIKGAVRVLPAEGAVSAVRVSSSLGDVIDACVSGDLRMTDLTQTRAVAEAIATQIGRMAGGGASAGEGKKAPPPPQPPQSSHDDVEEEEEWADEDEDEDEDEQAHEEANDRESSSSCGSAPAATGAEDTGFCTAPPSSGGRGGGGSLFDEL